MSAAARPPSTALALPAPAPLPALDGELADAGMSRTIGALSEALSKAQAELRGVRRDVAGQIENRSYRYASLDAVIDASREVLTRHGLAVAQPTEPHGLDAVCVVTILSHAKSGEWMRGRLVLPVAARTPKAFGSALTYARRYAYMAMIGIAPADDDDGTAAEAPRPAEARQAPRDRPSDVRAHEGPAPAPAQSTAQWMTDAEKRIVSDLTPKFERARTRDELTAVCRQALKRSGYQHASRAFCEWYYAIKQTHARRLGIATQDAR